MRVPLLALAALVAAQDPAPKVDIAWKLKKGEEFACEVSLGTSGKETERIYRSLHALHLGLAIREVGKDGKADVKAVIERIRFSIVYHPEGGVDIDTDGKEDEKLDALKRSAWHLKGKSFTLVIGPRGLESIGGLGEIVKEAVTAAGEAPGDIDRTSRRLAANLEQVIRYSVPTTPIAPVEAGGFVINDQFRFDYMSLRGSTMKDTKKIKSIENGRVDISHTLEITPAADSKVTEAGGTGRTVWNLERGLPESHEITAKTKSRIAERDCEEEHKVTLKITSRPKK